MPWWVVSVVALLLALFAATYVRSLSRRVDRLTQRYWELRYEHDRLQARVEPSAGAVRTADGAGDPGVASAFIPLSSVRREPNTQRSGTER
ncbi:MAG TPA: hypothetical protein VGK32_13740 [Vicinamibacterales bacterium]|jgi:hypothetical protein